MTGVLDSAVLVVALLRARAGWRRGFLSQALDLAGFAAAALLAYKFWCVLAGPWRFIGLSPRWASVAGGLTAFIPVIVIVAITGWKLGRLARQPGINMTNRLLGAGLAVVVAAVGLTFLQVALRFIPGYANHAPTAHALIDFATPAANVLESLARIVLPGGCAR